MEINFGKLLPGDIFRLPDGTWWVKATQSFAHPFDFDKLFKIDENKKVEVVK